MDKFSIRGKVVSWEYPGMAMPGVESMKRGGLLKELLVESDPLLTVQRISADTMLLKSIKETWAEGKFDKPMAEVVPRKKKK